MLDNSIAVNFAYRARERHSPVIRAKAPFEPPLPVIALERITLFYPLHVGRLGGTTSAKISKLFQAGSGGSTPARGA